MEVRFSGVQSLGAALTRPLRSAEQRIVAPELKPAGVDAFVRAHRTTSAQQSAEAALPAPLFEYRPLNRAFAEKFVTTRLI